MMHLDPASEERPSSTAYATAFHRSQRALNLPPSDPNTKRCRAMQGCRACPCRPSANGRASTSWRWHDLQGRGLSFRKPTSSSSPSSCRPPPGRFPPSIRRSLDEAALAPASSIWFFGSTKPAPTPRQVLRPYPAMSQRAVAAGRQSRRALPPLVHHPPSGESPGRRTIGCGFDAVCATPDWNRTADDRCERLLRSEESAELTGNPGWPARTPELTSSSLCGKRETLGLQSCHRQLVDARPFAEGLHGQALQSPAWPRAALRVWDRSAAN